MRYYLIIISFILLNTFHLNAQDTGFQFQKDSWRNIIKQAKSSGKPIFIQAMTSNCSACDEMEYTVFRDQELSAFYNESFILFKLDSNTKNVEKLEKMLSINAFPTSQFVDYNGNMIHKFVGVPTNDDLVDMAKRVLANKGTLAYYKSWYNKRQLGKDELFDFAYVLLKAAEDYKPIADQYFIQVTEEHMTDAQYIDAVVLFTDDIASREFTFLLRTNGDVRSRLFSTSEIIIKIEDVISNTIISSLESSQKEQNPKIMLDRILDKYEVRNPLLVRTRVMMDYYDFVKIDLERYFVNLADYMNFHLDLLSAEQIGAKSQRVLDECKLKEIVEVSLMWIDRAVSIEPENKNLYRIYINLLIKNGRFGEAEDLTKKMIMLCKDQLVNPKREQEVTRKLIERASLD